MGTSELTTSCNFVIDFWGADAGADIDNQEMIIMEVES